METPCIVLDMDKVCRNLKRMADICEKNHCHLRPHTKTHKIRSCHNYNWTTVPQASL